jgi:hypothetical protein
MAIVSSLPQAKVEAVIYVTCPLCESRVPAIAEHNVPKRFFFCSGCLFVWETTSTEHRAAN